MLHGLKEIFLVFSSVLSFRDTPSQRPEPTRVWSSHSLPVTDIHIGPGGYRCRVVSASLDQTCRVGDRFKKIILPRKKKIRCIMCGLGD